MIVSILVITTALMLYSPLYGSECKIKSELCKIYGIDERIQQLPVEIQASIVSELVKRYPQAFTHVVLRNTSATINKKVYSGSLMVLIDQDTKLGFTERAENFGQNISTGENIINNYLIYDIQTGTLVKAFSNSLISIEAISSDGKKIVVLTNPRVGIDIRDAREYTLLQELRPSRHGSPIQFFDQDKKLLVVPDGGVVQIKAQLWNLVEQRMYQTVPAKHRSYDPMPHDTPVEGAALSDNQAFMAFASDYLLLLYDMRHEVPQIIFTYQKDYWGSCWGMYFVDIDIILMAWDGGVIEWNLTCNRISRLFKYDTFSHISFNNNAEANATMKTLRLNKNELPILMSFTYYPLEKLFMTAITDGTVVLWDYALGQRRITLRDPEHVFAYDGIASLAKKKIFTLLKRRKPYQEYRDICTKSMRTAKLIRIWNIPEIPRSFYTGSLTIMQALFILFFHDLKQKSTSHVNENQYAALESLKSELVGIYATFSPDEKEFLNRKFLQSQNPGGLLFPREV